jgi:hypothetical protein
MRSFPLLRITRSSEVASDERERLWLPGFRGRRPFGGRETMIGTASGSNRQGGHGRVARAGIYNQRNQAIKDLAQLRFDGRRLPCALELPRGPRDRRS